MFNELQPQHLSRDQEVGKKYDQDPMVLRNITTRMGINSIANLFIFTHIII